MCGKAVVHTEATEAIVNAGHSVIGSGHSEGAAQPSTARAPAAIYCRCVRMWVGPC